MTISSRKAWLPDCLPPESLRKQRRPTEELDNQAALMKWAKLMEEQRPELGLLFAIPNESYLVNGSLQGKHLKAQGVTPGVPDLLLAVPTHRPPKVENGKRKVVVRLAVLGHCGLFIEMKVKGRKLSQVQRAMCTRLLESGYEVIICNTWGEARDAILHYLDEATDGVQ